MKDKQILAHQEQEKTGIFLGINPRRQLPTNTRKTTTMSTNLEGISTPVFKPLNDQNRKDPKIINLSSRDLTTNEIKLLKKGLKCTPTPETNKNELRNNIQEFGRKLRLIEYYDSHQNETDQTIMDKIFYKDKIEELLSDTENYTLNNGGNQDESIMKKIEKLLQKFKEDTTKAEKEYIHKFSWKTSIFYGLPKIHKSKRINEAINEQDAEYIKLRAPNDLKFRPIVAGPLSPTHRLSNFVDLILKPLCQHVPSFIRDDMDFLNYLPDEVEEHTLLVSFDVVSLYTSIPHDLTAIEYWIDNCTTSLPRPF